MTRYYLKIFTVILMTVPGLSLFSQSIDEQLQNKYWGYRNRLQKYFISYNKTQTNGGIGTPIHQHNIGKYGANVVDCQNPDATLKGHIKQGDAPEAIGMYIASLALEYRMLRDEGKNYTATLNEIYYLITAINRLDLNAEGYFGGSNTLDGFMKRGDGDDNLRQTFVNESAVTDDKEDKLSCIQSDGYNPSNPGQYDEANAISKDHIIDFFLGFSFIKKYLYDAPVVQPTFQDIPITLQAEVIGITQRIMQHITQDRVISMTNVNFTSFFYGSTVNFACSNFPISVTMNYVVFNPVLNKVVPRGNNINVMAYPLTNIAKAITNVGWDGIPLHIKVGGQVCGGWNYNVYDKYIPIGSIYDDLPTIWNQAGTTIANTINGNGVPGLVLEYCDNFYDAFGNGTQFCTDAVKDLSYSTTYNVYVTAYLMASLASQSGTWSQQNVVTLGDYYDMWQFDLQYALLNGTVPVHNQKTYWENILSTAPCDGPYNYKNPTNLNAYDPKWYTSNNWTHPSNPAFNPPHDNTFKEFQGDYPGIDYMFLYNMYRYYYKNQTPLQFGSNNSCSCAQNPIILNNTSGGTLNNSVTISRKFNSYKNIGIYIKEYISQNLNIPSGISLTNKTDLAICNNSIVEIENGGSFINNLTALPEDSVRIMVRKGSTLKVESGGTLNIGNNTRLYIEDGATIIIEPGSNIIIQDGGKIYSNYGSIFDLRVAANQTTWVRLEGPKSLLQVGATYGNTLPPNSTLKFGTSTSTQVGGGLAQFTSGNLIHYNNSNLIVDNCRLLFDYIYPDQNNPQLVQMNYRYVAGAKLQLPNHGILDIRGDLYLASYFSQAPDFTFTWPGTIKPHGYLRFSRPGWWGGSSVPHIIAAPASTITLVGKSKTDTMLQVAQETVYILDQNISKVSINKALIDFNGHAARLEITPPYDITNVAFRGHGRMPQFERGLEVYSNPVSGILQDCDFISLGYGLSLPLIFNNTNFKVDNCRFYGCAAGLHVLGGGVQASNCSFYGQNLPQAYFTSSPPPGYRPGTFGLYADGLTQNSNITNCLFDGQAMANINSSPVRTLFSRCLTRNAGWDNSSVVPEALDVYQGNVSLYCSTFRHVDNSFGNYEFLTNNPIGVIKAFNNSVIDMSSTTGVGFNNFDRNATASIYLENANDIKLDYGYNNVMADYYSLNSCYVSYNTNYGYYNSQSFIHSPTYCPFDIFGSMRLPFAQANCPYYLQNGQKYTLNSFANYWRKKQFLASNGSKQLGLNGMNWVSGTCFNPNDINFEFLDSQEASYRYANPYCNSTPQLHVVGPDNTDCPDCSVINIQGLGSKKTNEVADIALSKMNPSVNNGYRDAIELFYSLHTATNNNPSEGDYKIYNSSRRSMHEAYSLALNSGQLSLSNPNCAHLQKITTVLDSSINSVPDNSGSNYFVKLYATLEKAETYRLARLHSQALTEFTNAYNIAKTQDKNYVQRWICLTQFEQLVFNGQLNPSDFQPKVDSCSPMPIYNSQNARVGGSYATHLSADESMDDQKMSGNFVDGFNVYPNPADNELFIGYNIESEKDGLFEIYDVNGKRVRSFILNATNHLLIITLDLAPGVYNYRIVTNDKISRSDKLVIIKE